MNIKSLLIGSAAALAAVSGAQAADAIVAAEPEPLEYVRVCDAFGTGFFYIPGTETCLKFSGYVRFQTDFNRGNTAQGSGAVNARTSDWDSFTRAQFNIDTKTDTEVGAVRGFIELRGDADYDGASGLNIQQAFIELGGLKVGKFYNWWDDSLSGETDVLNTFALFNSARYTYDAGSFWAGVSVDELEGKNTSFLQLTGVNGAGAGLFTRENDNNVGISAGVGTKLAGFTLQLIGGYDVDQEEGAVRLMGTADIGPGTLGLAGIYSSGVNAYYAEAEWVFAAEYAIKATDRLTITPGAQYSWNVAAKGTIGEAGLTGAIVNGSAVTGAAADSVYYINNDWTNSDEWRAGVTVDYKITDGLSTKITANYIDNDLRDDQVSGFVRLQRNF